MINFSKSKIRNLLLNQGNPFGLTLKFRNSINPVSYQSLTDYRFKAQIRSLPDNESTLLQEITCTVQGLSNTELLLTIVPPFNILLVPNISFYNIPPNYEQLSKDKLPDSLYYWSLRSFDTNNAAISRILEGAVLVTSETTANL